MVLWIYLLAEEQCPGNMGRFRVPICCKMMAQENLQMLLKRKQKNYQKPAWLPGLFGSIWIRIGTWIWLYVLSGGVLMHLLIMEEILAKKHLHKIRVGGTLYCRLMRIM